MEVVSVFVCFYVDIECFDVVELLYREVFKFDEK